MRHVLYACLAIAAALNMSNAAAASPKIVAHRLVDHDGVGIAWWSAGVNRPGEPSVLFIHGGPGDGSQVLRATVMPLIAKSSRVLTFDLRGAGLSDAPTDPGLYSVAAVFDDIDAVLEAAGAVRALIVAHSAGTIGAFQYAERSPERVAGLVLTGAVPDLPALIDGLCERLAHDRPDVYPRAVKAAVPGQRCIAFTGFPTEAAQKAWFDSNIFPNEATRTLVTTASHSVEQRPWSRANTLLKDQMTFRVSEPERFTMPLLSSTAPPITRLMKSPSKGSRPV